VWIGLQRPEEIEEGFMPFKVNRHGSIPALWMAFSAAGFAQPAPIDPPRPSAAAVLMPVGQELNHELLKRIDDSRAHTARLGA